MPLRTTPLDRELAAPAARLSDECSQVAVRVEAGPDSDKSASTTANAAKGAIRKAAVATQR